MKYLAYAPTHGQEYNLMLSRVSRHIKGLALNVRYRYKERGRNITPSTQVDGHYLLEQTYRHQCMVDVEYKTGSWRLVSRMGYAHYNGDVTAGILDRNPGLRDQLFSQDTWMLGKTYVGADHYLYSYDDDTGYYYYDSNRNAASYNQRDGRFYVYNYTNLTNKSKIDSDSWKDSGRWVQTPVHSASHRRFSASIRWISSRFIRVSKAGSAPSGKQPAVI